MFNLQHSTCTNHNKSVGDIMLQVFSSGLQPCWTGHREKFSLD